MRFHWSPTPFTTRWVPFKFQIFSFQILSKKSRIEWKGWAKAQLRDSLIFVAYQFGNIYWCDFTPGPCSSRFDECPSNIQFSNLKQKIPNQLGGLLDSLILLAYQFRNIYRCDFTAGPCSSQFDECPSNIQFSNFQIRNIYRCDFTAVPCPSRFDECPSNPKFFYRAEGLWDRLIFAAY